jgi:hypothetical protein
MMPPLPPPSPSSPPPTAETQQQRIDIPSPTQPLGFPSPAPIDLRFKRPPSPPSSLPNRRYVGSARSRSTVSGYSIYHTPLSSFFTTASIAPSASSSTPPRSPPPSQQGTIRKSADLPPPPPTITTTTAVEVQAPDNGPRLFWTSAKTGEGVKDVFEYIATRVVTRWDWDDRLEAQASVSVHCSLCLSNFTHHFYSRPRLARSTWGMDLRRPNEAGVVDELVRVRCSAL